MFWVLENPDAGYFHCEPYFHLSIGPSSQSADEVGAILMKSRDVGSIRILEENLSPFYAR